ncbi:MAG: hypothetical protein KF760_19220 [Candidatus Eremiobacteraeota bacterium]|nr:hypothetical protein [Candidatus Eremiobacteraeota bacterium]MCW5869946.1 hypothetical protein [Candidatus Eremiobacteraeota bacterium]
MERVRELAGCLGGATPLWLFYALLQLHPELPFGPVDSEQTLLFARMLQAQNEGATAFALADTPIQAFHQLVQHPEVVQLYWWQGQFAPIPSGEQAAAANPFWRCPGGTQALLYGHAQVRPLHQFLEGLSEARYQSSFAALRKQIFKQAERREPLFLRWSELEQSPEAAEVLRELVVGCLHWGAEPTPIHLSLIAFSHTIPFLESFLGPAELESLRRELEDEVLGRLPRSRWLLDGLTPDDANPSVIGTRLTRGSELLLGPESRYDEAEKLLGRGRVGRWLEGEFGRLKVTFDQSVLETIEWRQR